MSGKIIIDTGDETGIILCCSSGVFYTNQTGDIACEHPEQEGAYVPLGPINDLPCWVGNGVPDPDALDRVLEPRRIRVDRDRADDSMEAWIHCRTLAAGKTDWDTPRWPEGLPCVLTYMNCD